MSDRLGVTLGTTLAADRPLKRTLKVRLTVKMLLILSHRNTIIAILVAYSFCTLQYTTVTLLVNILLYFQVRPSRVRPPSHRDEALGTFDGRRRCYHRQI